MSMENMSIAEIYLMAWAIVTTAYAVVTTT